LIPFNSEFKIIGEFKVFEMFKNKVRKIKSKIMNQKFAFRFNLVFSKNFSVYSGRLSSLYYKHFKLSRVAKCSISKFLNPPMLR
jgi:hypothetical protein